MIYKFGCPSHNDVILYEESDEERRNFGFVAPEKPRVCHKCQKPYYKWECNEIVGRED